MLPSRSMPSFGRVARCALAVVLSLAAVAAGAAEPARVSGTVVDPDDQPVPAASVVLETPLGIARTTSADASGRFDVANLPPGAYVVRASHPGMLADPVRLHLVAGERRDLTLVLRISAITEHVVVSAARVEEPSSSTPAAITTFTAADLDARQVEFVADALRLVPGFSVTQSGGRGGLTSVFPRGGESDFTLVLLDGVRQNSFGGGFDVSMLSAADVERVEVVRGPQSAVFGSDAVGGVVQVISRNGGPTRAAATFEGGSLETARGTASLAGSTRPWTWGGSLERWASTGFTGTAPGTGEAVSNDDGRRSAGAGSLRFTSGDWNIAASARRMHTERGYPGPYGSDPNGTYGGVDRVSRGWNEHTSAGLQAAAPLAPRWRLRASAAWAELDSRYRSPYDTSTFGTRRLDALAQIDAAVSDSTGVSVGAQTLGERADSTYITDGTSTVPVRRRVTGVFGEGRIELPNRVMASAGLRLEHITREALAGDPNQFAPRPDLAADTVVSLNPRAAVSWFVREAAPGTWSWTRLRANAGTGIRPPDAFEIAYTDNPGLQPERSRSLDVGVEQALFDARLVVDASAFFNRYDDLIVAVGPAFPDASRYRTDNIANARARGVEIGASARVHRWLSVRGGYALVDSAVLAVDGGPGAAPPPFDPGDPLIRRPRHQGWLEALATHDRWSAFARLGARGRVLDVDPTYGAFAGKLVAPGYAVADAGGSVVVWRATSMFVRVTNLFDRAYEEAFGFPSPGRSWFGGIRVATRR